MIVPARSGTVFGIAIYRGSLVVMSRQENFMSGWVNEPSSPERGVNSILNFLWFIQGKTVAIGVPLWLCSLFFGYLSVRSIRRRKEPLPGHCRVCGYDLRATPDRCPECGTIPPKEEIISN